MGLLFDGGYLGDISAPASLVLSIGEQTTIYAGDTSGTAVCSLEVAGATGAVTYAQISETVAGLTVNTSTGAVALDADAVFATNPSASYTATDENGVSNTVVVTVTVLAVQLTDPVFTPTSLTKTVGDAIGQIATVSATGTGTIVFDASSNPGFSMSGNALIRDDPWVEVSELDVVVDASDDSGQTTQGSIQITVNAATPTVTITAPADAASVTAATAITLGGNLTDADVSVDNANWTVYTPAVLPSVPSTESFIQANPDFTSGGDGYTAIQTVNYITSSSSMIWAGGPNAYCAYVRHDLSSIPGFGIASCRYRARYSDANSTYVSGDYPLTIRITAEDVADSALGSGTHHISSGWAGDTTAFVDWTISTIPTDGEYPYTPDLQPIVDELVASYGDTLTNVMWRFRVISTAGDINSTTNRIALYSAKSSQLGRLYETHYTVDGVSATTFDDIPQYSGLTDTLYARNEDPGIASISVSSSDSTEFSAVITSPISGMSFLGTDTIDYTGPSLEASRDNVNWTAATSGVTTLADLTGPTISGGDACTVYFRHVAAPTATLNFVSEYNAALGATRHSTRPVLTGLEGKRIGGVWTNYGGSGRHTFPPTTPDHIRVTSTARTGAGTLREAVDHVGPAIITFDVSGTLDMANQDFDLNQPYKTILFNTAPSPGFQLINGVVAVQAPHIAYSDMEVYNGGGRDNKDTIASLYENNIHGRNCLFAFSTDENQSSYGGTNSSSDSVAQSDIGYTRTLFAYPLLKDGNHAYNAQAGYNNARMLYRDCGFVGGYYRNPFFFGPGSGAIIGCKGIVAKTSIVGPPKGILIYGKDNGTGDKIVDMDVIGNEYHGYDTDPNTQKNFYLCEINGTVHTDSGLYMAANYEINLSGLLKNTGGANVSTSPINDLDGITLPTTGQKDQAWHDSLGPRPWDRANNSFVTGCIETDLENNQTDIITLPSEKGGYPTKAEATSVYTVTGSWTVRDEEGFLEAERELDELQR